MMKRFLTLTAIIEAATGLALIAVPALVVRLLLGAEISGASIPLGRVAGRVRGSRIANTQNPTREDRPGSGPCDG